MTAWHEIIVEGPEEVLRALALGFSAGRPGSEAALLGTDIGLAPSSFHERLRELFAAGTHHLLVAPAAMAAELTAALRSHGTAVDLNVVGLHEVVGARLPFTVLAFSAEVARGLREQLLESLPEGVRLTGLEESVEEDPSLRGTELYAPAHGYTFKASGEYLGPLPGVLEMQRRAQVLEFVTPGELCVETREVSPA